MNNIFVLIFIELTQPVVTVAGIRKHFSCWIIFTVMTARIKTFAPWHMYIITFIGLRTFTPTGGQQVDLNFVRGLTLEPTWHESGRLMGLDTDS